MKKILLLVTIIFTIISCSKEKTVEEIYEDCYFKSLPDNGKLIKGYHQQYEAILISSGILKSTEGKDYQTLFKKLVHERFFDSINDFSMMDSIKDLDYAELLRFNKKCTDTIKAMDIYKNSNTYKIEKATDSIIRLGADFDDALVVFTDHLTEADFNLDYYKIRTLMILNMNKGLHEMEAMEGLE